MLTKAFEKYNKYLENIGLYVTKYNVITVEEADAEYDKLYMEFRGLLHGLLRFGQLSPAEYEDAMRKCDNLVTIHKRSLRNEKLGK